MKKFFFFATVLSLSFLGCADVLSQVPVTVMIDTEGTPKYRITFIDGSSGSIEAMPGATVRFTAQATESETEEIDQVWYEAAKIKDTTKHYLTPSETTGIYEFLVPQYTIKLVASTKAKG